MLITTLILSAALAAQSAPTPRPVPDMQAGYADVIARNRARRSRRAAAGRAREEAEARAAYAAELKAEAEYKAALPYLMENQRQMLERQSAMERNAALHRMASASERLSEAVLWDAYNRSLYRGR
jgi:hypothetical protein